MMAPPRRDCVRRRRQYLPGSRMTQSATNTNLSFPAQAGESSNPRPWERWQIWWLLDRPVEPGDDTPRRGNGAAAVRRQSDPREDAMHGIVRSLALATALAAASSNVLFVHPSVPAHSVNELIDLIKRSPGKYSYAQPSTGSTPHLSGELLKLQYGLDLVTVPFNGASLAVNSTLAGHTPIAFTALPPAIANIKEGNLRGLAVTAAKRSAALPDVPTMAEAGVPDQEAETINGLLVPAGTPADIIARINRDTIAALSAPDVKERLMALGFEPAVTTPAEFGVRIKSEIAKWDKVVRAAHIRIE